MKSALLSRCEDGDNRLALGCSSEDIVWSCALWAKKNILRWPRNPGTFGIMNEAAQKFGRRTNSATPRAGGAGALGLIVSLEQAGGACIFTAASLLPCPERAGVVDSRKSAGAPWKSCIASPQQKRHCHPFHTRFTQLFQRGELSSSFSKLIDADATRLTAFSLHHIRTPIRPPSRWPRPRFLHHPRARSRDQSVRHF